MSADLIQRLRDRRVTNWVHSTGTPPLANGFAHDADCQKAATELERLTAELAAARAEAEGLRADAERLDWLADKENTIGNVQLPSWCVEQNLHSLRAAIDAARQAG